MATLIPWRCAYYGASGPFVHTLPFRAAVRNDDPGGARPAGVRSGAPIFEPRGALGCMVATLRVALGGRSASATPRGGSIPVHEGAGAHGYALVKVMEGLGLGLMHTRTEDVEATLRVNSGPARVRVWR